MLKTLDSILERELTPEAWQWLSGLLNKTNDKSALQIAFTAMPRHTGKSILSLDEEDVQEISQLLPEFNITNYTADRLGRVRLLQHFPADDKASYLKTIGHLFRAAEMNELVALYGALPLLAYPEEWVKQCADGIRSNIGVVLEAIMCDNPYPSKYLDEPAWNQLVLKAFFTEKPVNRIIGLDERANKQLAYILSDYAHERWSAGRTVNPQLWRLTANFIDERIFADLKKVFTDGSRIEKSAVILACYQSEYMPAKDLLDQNPNLKSFVESNQLNWAHIAQSA